MQAQLQEFYGRGMRSWGWEEALSTVREKAGHLLCVVLSGNRRSGVKAWVFWQPTRNENSRCSQSPGKEHGNMEEMTPDGLAKEESFYN